MNHLCLVSVKYLKVNHSFEFCLSYTTHSFIHYSTTYDCKVLYSLPNHLESAGYIDNKISVKFHMYRIWISIPLKALSLDF